MNEHTLGRLSAHRRTWTLLGKWKVPAGVDLAVLRRDSDELQIDVILMHQGHSVRSLGVKFSDQEECDASMDFLKDLLMDEARRAYLDRKVILPEGTVVDVGLIKAGLGFQDFIDEIACRGKGGRG